MGSECLAGLHAELKCSPRVSGFKDHKDKMTLIAVYGPCTKLGLYRDMVYGPQFCGSFGPEGKDRDAKVPSFELNGHRYDGCTAFDPCLARDQLRECDHVGPQGRT